MRPRCTAAEFKSKETQSRCELNNLYLMPYLVHSFRDSLSTRDTQWRFVLSTLWLTCFGSSKT